MNTKKIGVWGLGVAGKSVINFLQHTHIKPTILAQNYSSADTEYIEQNKLAYCRHNAVHEFLENHDTIIPSPGIDLRPYAAYAHKWMFEVDLFQQHNTIPCIAITGTIGKTSLTHLLGQVLANAQTKILLGGNIGIGMLDLLIGAPPADYMVLELSSFQLEHAKLFAPDIAVITNIYPNHLDRHGTLEHYCQAKYAILAQQKNQQQALLPIELYDSATAAFPHRTFSFFSTHTPAHDLKHTYYYIDNNMVIKKTSEQTQSLISISQFPALSFITNWLILTSILDMLSLDAHAIIMPHALYNLPQHRMDNPIIYQEISFYNDSKSTLMQSTIAAVDKMHTPPLLLLGGLSKGVDRVTLLPLLKDRVKGLICFGKEAAHLAAAARTIDISASAHVTLDEAFNTALTHAQKGDCILLSPGGSSYDLFSDYKERGAYFEELVKKYGAQEC